MTGSSSWPKMTGATSHVHRPKTNASERNFRRCIGSPASLPRESWRNEILWTSYPGSGSSSGSPSQSCDQWLRLFDVLRCRIASVSRRPPYSRGAAEAWALFWRKGPSPVQPHFTSLKSTGGREVRPCPVVSDVPNDRCVIFVPRLTMRTDVKVCASERCYHPRD